MLCTTYDVDIRLRMAGRSTDQSLAAGVRWKELLSKLRGKPVRLEISLMNADLFALEEVPSTRKSLRLSPDVECIRVLFDQLAGLSNWPSRLNIVIRLKSN